MLSPNQGGEPLLEHDQLADPSPEAEAALELWLSLQGIFDEFAQERGAQLAQWGDQPLPLGFGAHEFAVAADHFRRLCDEANERGDVTHRHVLLEEVYEALAESDPAKARDELIQVGAVVIKIIQDIDRQSGQATDAH